ncbi:hypothetical protein [Bradyrhizobium sp. Ai1a-2]|uniref:hypothetical protein n=1 Tax=Bradyrhizobium sp. Ai1a-2 TaxID=196490 RepID=UPI00042A41E6|nr:hypothetical protein [Bradyrhizobium sp. Ai1a-2]
MDQSRRKLIRTLLGSAPAAFLLRGSQANAAEKMTLQQAAYQDSPNGIYSCGMCTFFEAPKSCKVVAGDISRDGWCKVFAAVD